MNHDIHLPTTPRLDRRRFLLVGGLGAATTALVAACGGDDGEAGRVGVAERPQPLPDAVVSDVALLRTATSLEYSAIGVYDAVFDLGILPGAVTTAATRFRDEHQGHADALAGLTEDAGGEAWRCGNPRIDQVVLAPVLDRILNGVPAGADPAVPPSDDPLRDVLNVAHALETLAAATYQSLVPLLNDRALRRTAMVIAADEARHASLLALTMNTSRPGGYIPTAGAATTDTTVADDSAPATEIPAVTALPSQFGLLSAVQLVVGAPDVNGARLKANLDTLSLNSLVYEYEGACPAG